MTTRSGTTSVASVVATTETKTTTGAKTMADYQMPLFESRAVSPPPCDPNVTEAVEAKRLSAQCRTMLDAFRAAGVDGMTNDDLARISRKYTSRISDLRAAGYEVRIIAQNFKTGLVVYRLFNP
jgi:hypothetical protein